MNKSVNFMDIVLHIILIYFIKCVVGQTDINSDTTLAPSTPRPSSSRLENMRRRSRFQRINNIRQHVLTTLGFSSPPQIDEDMKLEILRNLSLSGIPYRAISQQCYSGSCSLPNWIDEELWNDPDTKTLRLYFDILPPEGSSTTILNSTLRLHIKERTACRCFMDDDETDGDDSVRFTVFVSQFLKPLKRRNRVPRMRILDVKMVVVRRDTWISFNVAEAVQEWTQPRRRRRHGLEVNVIDSQGFPIDAKAVFGNVDCSLPADIECQDITLPVTVQQNMNFTTSPMLEVYTETRPNIEFRNKREAAVSGDQDSGSAPFSALRRRLRNLIKCGSFDCP